MTNKRIKFNKGIVIRNCILVFLIAMTIFSLVRKNQNNKAIEYGYNNHMSMVECTGLELKYKDLQWSNFNSSKENLEKAKEEKGEEKKCKISPLVYDYYTIKTQDKEELLSLIREYESYN